jgi:outer membrane protein TolC
MRPSRAVAALVLAALAGCALKSPPDPAELRRQALPNLQAPERWASDGALGASVAESWLATFDDRLLTALVEEALAYNADLRVAGARVEQAAGYAAVAAAGLYPAVNLLARGGGKMSGDNSGLQGAGLIASWEVDVWGRVRYGRAAADAQYASALADLEYARQSLAALVAKS